MGRWLSLALAEGDEKNLKTPLGGTPETPETTGADVLGVSGVVAVGVCEKKLGAARGEWEGFGGFGGAADGGFAQKFSETAPVERPYVAPLSHLPVASAASAVARLLDAMAAENARRRDWWARPVEGWREGRLTMRSIVTGESETIHLRKNGPRS